MYSYTKSTSRCTETQNEAQEEWTVSDTVNCVPNLSVLLVWLLYSVILYVYCMYICTFMLERELSVAMMVTNFLSGERSPRLSRLLPETFSRTSDVCLNGEKW